MKKDKDVFDEILEDEDLIEEAELATADLILKYAKAKMNDVEIAARMGITITKLAELEGLIIQDDPDFMTKKANAKHYKKAKSKENTLEAIDNGDVKLSQWELERTDVDYSPKQIISVDTNTELDEDEKKLIDNVFGHASQISSARLPLIEGEFTDEEAGGDAVQDDSGREA